MKATKGSLCVECS